MKKLLSFIAVAALSLALPTAAGAGLPKASSSLIVPGRSIGGVALGATSGQITTAWGKTPECKTQCRYPGVAPTGETEAFANVLLESKTDNAPYKAWMITIAVGTKVVGEKAKPDFNTPLTAYKTSKGIGLGSKESELKAAYHGLKTVSDVAGNKVYELPGGGEEGTIFVLFNSTKITSITVESHHGG